MPNSIEHKIAVDASPISHVTGDDAAILLVHGDADPVVAFSQSASMFSRLQQAGVTSRLVRVENGGHGFNFGGHKPPNLDTIQVKWMDEHLRGH